MPKILIVDDEWLTRLEIEEMLTALGYEVVGQAETGEEAVAMARELKPDLILMDMAMPGEMNGIDAARVIKAEFGTPIIFISGYGDPAYIEAAKEIEPFGYVMKPFDETEVHAFVEIALSKRALELKLKKAHEGLERTNFILQEEIAARKERERALRESEKALRKAHDELERRVEIRTAELSKANKLLQEENEARKRSEEALRESDKRLNAILDATTETIVLFDREGIVHVANQTACDRLRTTKEEFIGKRIYDFFPPDVAEGRRQKWNEVFDTGKPVSFEDSREGMIFAQRAYPILDDGGQVEMVTAFANDKTDRKQAEEGLRESEERYRNLVEESFDGIFIQKGPNIIFANKRLNEMLGYEEGELLGQNHWVVYHPDFQELTRERAQARMSGEDVVPRYEVKLQRKDGSWFYGEINAGPITFPSNQENGIQVWVKDIHVRKQAEEALRESEAFLKTMVNAIPAPIFYKDRDGKYLGCNSAFERFFGSTRKQLIGKSVFDIHPLELAETYHNKDDELFNSGEVQNYQSQWKTSNGNVRDIIFNKAVFTDNEGDIRGLIGTIMDITERKRADEALRESEIRYRELVENAVLGIFQVTRGGKFLMANQRMANIFGYDSQQDFFANAHNITELYVNPEERSKLLLEIEDKGRVDGKEMNFRRKDGNPIFCNAYARSIKSEEGEYLYEGLLEDITDKKKMEDQLHHAEKMKAIGTLAGGVAHDLNNILGGLVGYPELLLLQLPEDSPLRKSILTIQKSGEKAAAVVEDLLALARRGVVATEVVKLNEVITEYLKSPECENLQSYHPGVHLETHLEKDVLNMLGSSTHLSKTIMNLVSNAAEAMLEGGKITISTENRYIDRPIRGYDNVKEGDYVVLTIADTGAGISPDDIGKVYEPFYTKKKMGRSGTGLGMSVVWGTVKDHNGYIDVQSTEGEGTTFTLYFPVTRKELPEDKSHLAIGSYSGNGESILIVDDVEEQRNIASGMLKELGYSVVSVSSGEEAVEYLRTNKVDLLVLDMIMDPGMDGLDTYKKILEIHPGQKAIIASGFSETERVKEVQSLGAGAYIRKPLLLEKIGIAVKEELEK